MSAVITLSDSDDSDDLPPFAERVKRLINADVKEEKRSVAPKQNLSQIHSISDSDDSRDTIPFARSRSASPICSLPEFPKFNLDRKSDNKVSYDDTPDLNHRNNVSPFLSLDSKKWDAKQKYISFSSDDDLPCLSYKTGPTTCNIAEDAEYNSNTRDSMNSDDDISSKTTNIHMEKGSKNEAEKEAKKKIRLEKKKEKELMKALKASEKEIMKSQKPEECLKNMKIVLDRNILYLEGNQSLLNSLDQHNLKYSIEENNFKYCVNWYRKMINISTENHEIVREEREELTDTLVMIIPNEDFLRMVYAYVQKAKGKSSDNSSLTEHIVIVKSLYPNCDITCLTIGFQKYMRNIKEEGTFDLKSIVKQVHKNASEEAIIELQLQSTVNFKFLENMNEFGNLLHYFTKAIAGAPQRKEKQMHKALAFSWYADIDSHCPIKLSKDGSSFIKLWQQQIQQFQNVGPEVAEAIVSRYPSPRLLLKAYRRCISIKDAENLLQDIVVRRNYGPLGTQKRIGPELSYKLHLFFTSRDGNKLLKR